MKVSSLIHFANHPYTLSDLYTLETNKNDDDDDNDEEAQLMMPLELQGETGTIPS